MIPLNTPIGSQIQHADRGRVVIGTFVGFKNSLVRLIPNNKISSYTLFSYDGQEQYCFYNDSRCSILEVASIQTTQNKVLSRSLLLEKRFKEKQDAKKKKAVPVQDDQSKREKLARLFERNDHFYGVIWDDITERYAASSQTGRTVNNQLGQLNGATWPFTTR